MTCAAFCRACVAFWRAWAGAALARFTKSLDVFLTELAARPAAAVARPMALPAFFTGPGAAAFRRAVVAGLAGDDFARAAMPPPDFFPLPEDPPAERPAAALAPPRDFPPEARAAPDFPP